MLSALSARAPSGEFEVAQLNYALIASLSVPIVAAAIGWFALWRRNKIIYKIENAHFCGDELTKAGFWKDKENRRPLVDALNFSSFNFGLKHVLFSQGSVPAVD